MGFKRVYNEICNEYVEIISDGKKNWTTCVRELYSLLDITKVNGNSYILMSDGGVFINVHAVINASGAIKCIFTRAITLYEGTYVQTIDVRNTGAAFVWRVITGSGSSYQDGSSSMVSGTLRLYY